MAVPIAHDVLRLRLLGVLYDWTTRGRKTVEVCSVHRFKLEKQYTLPLMWVPRMTREELKERDKVSNIKFLNWKSWGDHGWGKILYLQGSHLL